MAEEESKNTDGMAVESPVQSAPIRILGQLAEPGFKILLEGQEGGGRSPLEGDDVPEIGSHNRKGSSPETCQAEFLGQQDLQHASSACTSRADLSHWSEMVPQVNINRAISVANKRKKKAEFNLNLDRILFMSQKKQHQV